MAAILNSANLVFSHLSFPSQTHSHLPRLVPTICTKKTLTHSFWLNLMMAATLNSAKLDSDTAILDSDTLLSSVRFTQKHSLSTLTLTQTNAIWLTRWWQPSWILPSWIQPFCTKLWLNLIQSDSNSFILTQLDDGSHLECCHLGFSHLHKKTSLMYSHSNWWWQPSWILPSWIQHFAQKNFTCSFWLNLMMAAIWILLHLGLKHCHLWFRHLVIFSQIHSKTFSLHTLTQTNSIWLKLIHSHLPWWWQPPWILPSWIWPSWIQPS